MTLYDLCEEIKNFFEVDKKFDTFTIENGSLSLDFLQEGQYFRIVGSVFNDGIYQYPTDELADETFNGSIWALAIPPNVIALKSDIDSWLTAYGDKVQSPYQSESFGGYSYSKSNSGADSTGNVTWRSAFKSSLNKWRKI